MKSKCLVCDLNKSKKFLVFNGKDWQVDRPMDINLNGLFFIKTKRHVEELEDLTNEESSELGTLIKQFSKESKMISKAERVLAMSLGLSNPHIHFWILPMTGENKNEVMKISKAVKKISERYRH